MRARERNQVNASVSQFEVYERRRKRMTNDLCIKENIVMRDAKKNSIFFCFVKQNTPIER